MDLLLHIGLGKTGTTTLQQEHFIGLPGYLGRRELFGQRGRGGRLEQVFLAARQGQPVDLEAWRSDVLRAFRGAPPDQIVISQERLVQWTERGSGFSPIVGLLSDGGRIRRSGSHPIAAFVRDHVVPAWEPLGRVKVLVTLRNQFDWLCSHYAQLSNRIIGASQADFTRQVERIVRTGDPYLDFASLIDALRGAVGTDHVTALLLEDIGSAQYWETLSALVGQRLPREDRTTKRANQRSSGDGWQLRPYDRRRYPLRVTLLGQVPSPGRPSMWTVRGLAHPVQSGRVILQRRGTSIRPTEELRVAVRSCYRESNVRLGGILGRDLAPLGY